MPRARGIRRFIAILLCDAITTGESNSPLYSRSDEHLMNDYALRESRDSAGSEWGDASRIGRAPPRSVPIGDCLPLLRCGLDSKQSPILLRGEWLLNPQSRLATSIDCLVSSSDDCFSR